MTRQRLRDAFGGRGRWSWVLTAAFTTLGVTVLMFQPPFARPARADTVTCPPDGPTCGGEPRPDCATLDQNWICCGDQWVDGDQVEMCNGVPPPDCPTFSGNYICCGDQWVSSDSFSCCTGGPVYTPSPTPQ